MHPNTLTPPRFAGLGRTLVGGGAITCRPQQKKKKPNSTAISRSRKFRRSSVVPRSSQRLPCVGHRSR